MAKKKTKGAGAFDIRNVIGALIGFYGIVLVLAAFLLDPGINADTGEPKNAMYNLYVGLALVVVAIVFMAWAKFRPIAVKDPDAKNPQVAK